MNLSDIISFHHYGTENDLKENVIKSLKEYAHGRPLMCTEYMARTSGSTFEPHLNIMKNENIIAINWGFVYGRIQTIYPWTNDRTNPATEEPEIWFHDILRNDGTPFNSSEPSYIKSILKK
jgi:hypothetical protein